MTGAFRSLFPPKERNRVLDHAYEKNQQVAPTPARNAERPKVLDQQLYDGIASSHNLSEYDWHSGAEWVNPALRAPYLWLEEWLSTRCAGKVVLDYGCGEGIFSIFPARRGANVIGVDISSLSLAMARRRARLEGVDHRIHFCQGDCEALAVGDESIDVVMICGTLPCLDLESALREVSRVLKRDGQAIIVTTLGHNRILNLWRAISARRGIITSWECEHILRLDDLRRFRHYFAGVTVEFFDLLCVGIAPLVGRVSHRLKALVPLFVALDRRLLKAAWFQKQAFKVVVELSLPRKPSKVAICDEARA
jgi:ubiquinone/menaquinone biosynthesis C-methylase UbiE